MPLDVIAEIHGGNQKSIFSEICRFQETADVLHLKVALHHFLAQNQWNIPTMILEVAKHFEEGANKYGENNWQKGIPVKCYIDSAIRHYLKWLRGDQDEPHNRAFCWNIICAIWTCEHKPELNDYRKGEENAD